MMKNRHTALGLLVVLLLLAACADPLAPERSAYVGHWSAPGASLLITQDGSVAYQRMKGGASTSINAPLKKFEGDNFVVGIGLWTTTFVVSKPPRAEAGRWKMTVDGVELSREAPAQTDPPGQPHDSKRI